MNGKRNRLAFTLMEMLISISILALLVVLISRLFVSAASATTAGNKRMDSDLEARLVFSRFAVDIAQMIKRTDVDYYVKSTVDPQAGNDRIAFFSQVPGYYPSTGSASPTSLVAYRINSDSNSKSFHKMERLGKGLLWTGDPSTATPLLFGLTAIFTNWPNATSDSATDSDYETVGPQIFRFEYYYQLKGGAVADNPGAQGMQDVVSITVCVATIDPKTKVLVSDSQIDSLVRKMNDFSPSMKPGDLLKQWRTALDQATGVPSAALSSIRLYQRTFSLLPKA
jgi:prepilin-type N-terminal cleavage/methylation domain-containing protein